MDNVVFDSRVRDVLANVQVATDDDEHLSVEHVTEIRRRFDLILSEALADAHERAAKDDDEHAAIHGSGHVDRRSRARGDLRR